MPKRMRSTCSSRGVRSLRSSRVSRESSLSPTASSGGGNDRSSTKSPIVAPPSSPTGESRLTGIARRLEQHPDLLDRHVHARGDLLRRRLLAALLHHVAKRLRELVVRLDHVHRDADGPRLVADRAADALANPPARVRAELVAALVFELVDRAHQAEVALLNQVEQVQAAVSVALGDRHDEAQVRGDEVGLGALGLRFAARGLR